MIEFYSLVILGSAFVLARLASLVIRHVLLRAGGSLRYLSFGVLLMITGFLMVVSMPAALLLAVMLLSVAAMAPSEALSVRSWRAILPMGIAAILGVLSLQESPGAWPISLPLPAIMGILWLGFFGHLLLSYGARMNMLEGQTLTLAALLPVAITPLIYAQAHVSLSMDVGIIIAGLAGGARYADHRAHCPPFFLMPLAMLIAYLAVQAVRYGAAPMAMLSMLIWLIGIFVLSRRKGNAT